MKRILVKLRRILGLYTLADIEFAMQTMGDAQNRQDFEWKLKKRLATLVLL